MIRARTGGTGDPFNVGEMTVTRCALRTESGAMGVAYVKGRDLQHAELAALFDALMQDPRRRPELEDTVIAPLERAQADRRDTKRRRAAATKVDFFTMATGRESR